MTQEELDKIIKGKWDNPSLFYAAEATMMMGQAHLTKKITNKMTYADRVRYFDKLFREMTRSDQSYVLKVMEKDIEKKETK